MTTKTTKTEVKKFLAALTLQKGAHSSVEDGACVMEAVSYVAGEPFSDRPKCASEVIGAFLRSWNDSLDDDGRQMLKPYVLKLVGTAASKKIESKRAYLAVDWSVRVSTPTWLELAGLTSHADALRKLGKIYSNKNAGKARPIINAARAAAAYAAAASASAASASAAHDAASAAAAHDAASAAHDAASAANAAYATTYAYAAAYTAAYATTYAYAAPKALAPTVSKLQKSALGLLDAMIAVK